MSKRKNFGRLPEILSVPDLISVQLDSYEDFLQLEVDPLKREDKGLQEALKDIFPIESFDESCRLDFVKYEIGEQNKKIVDCLKDGLTYDAPLYVTFRLENTVEEKTSIIEERVFLGDIPMMTNRATFIINGAERVIISQLHRAPGLCFESSLSLQGRTLYSCRIIPDRGSWIEIQYDNNDLLYVYLDRRYRRRKFLISTLIRSLGIESNRELLDVIYGIEKASIAKLKKDPTINEKIVVEDVVDESGSIIVKSLEPLSDIILEQLKELNIKQIEFVDVSILGNYFILSLQKDTSTSKDEALKLIYSKMRPSDPVNLTNAKQLVNRLFFDVKLYDLGLVGRYKINQRLNVNVDKNHRTLHIDDIIATTKNLMQLRYEEGKVDDIDHLGNRRVRTVGELVQNQFKVGFARTERLVREKMSINDSESTVLNPTKLINAKALQSVIRDFFGRSQLSQFMDQTNPLAELTSKRRLSALGPGGLSRERAGFEVRDVHSSHYGRVCPIETPEGPNIGLISSLAIFSKINSYGFLETPYRKVKDAKVSDEIEYLSADEEEGFTIAQANAQLDNNSNFVNNFVLSRKQGDSFDAENTSITHMDVSPKQLVSPATSCIPFLEHDDANRALMGSNMQRQAVPLMVAEAPLVGTGMESTVAKDSRAVCISQIDGIVASCNSEQIIITKDGTLPKDESSLDNSNVYELYKYVRSNSSTNMNQKPIVKSGDKVVKGQVIADGFSTDGGELALGKNVLVAFMPWCGYNFEDAIILSDRLVEEDVYTSIHISEANTIARDTKLGPEEITRDTPNISEEALRNLDPEGVIRLGAEVSPGDILVGKVTPKSETELAPEERLLRAIFGDKAADVKDSSLYVPTGVSGTVMDIRIERKVDPHKTAATKADIKRKLNEAAASYKAQYQEFLEDLSDKLGSILLGSKLSIDVYKTNEDGDKVLLIPANRKITKVLLKKLAKIHDCYEMADSLAKSQIDEVMKAFSLQLKDIELRNSEVVNKINDSKGVDEGVIKSVKVYIAAKRKISVGDKMAGRHGNKGIISNIVSRQDLPFTKDGTIVDIILNPLGVPSRMNVGQVLETHLGWAAKKLGMTVATPVFDGIKEQEIKSLLQEANLPEDGKTELFDGRTGEKFAQRVMVGYIYMLKLDHLVVNKIHARSVGPYSLVTQQPLGGKAQHGGQRFGEMEVWALESYGAAYTLQEMLTVKSDDVIGRTKIYESIIRGDSTLVSGVPESFNVLMKEMHSLCLDIRVTRV